MSKKLQFLKGNTEVALEARGGSYIPGAIYHYLDTDNTYLATSTTVSVSIGYTFSAKTNKTQPVLVIEDPV